MPYGWGMAALTTAQEYAVVREAIQTLTATGASTVSWSVDGVSHTYNASQLPQLQARELELARRLTIRNTRKRTIPEFY
jgi:hypothetical protein